MTLACRPRRRPPRGPSARCYCKWVSKDISRPLPAGTEGHDGNSRWNLDAESDAILAYINDSDSPVGARQISGALAAQGAALSESTTSRRLRELDAKGLTRSVGAKGRAITALGAEVVARDRRASNARLVAATEIRDAAGLIHLLRARRAIEPEALRDATLHVTDAELRDLRSLTGAHRQEIQQTEPAQSALSVEFHRRLAAPVRNPIVRSMHHLVLDSNLQHVDSTLDIILSDHAGIISSIDAHTAILDAMERRDADAAANLMREHVETLINETEAFIAANGTVLVNHLLRSMIGNFPK